MNNKTKKIIHWVLAGLIFALFTFSAIGKIFGSPEVLQMAASFGIKADAFKILGFVEIIAAILFLIPRTAVVGTLLLVAYMGGAIATHLQHNQPIMSAVGIAAFVWIVAAIRIPELSNRLLGK